MGFIFCRFYKYSGKFTITIDKQYYIVYNINTIYNMLYKIIIYIVLKNIRNGGLLWRSQ